MANKRDRRASRDVAAPVARPVEASPPGDAGRDLVLTLTPTNVVTVALSALLGVAALLFLSGRWALPATPEIDHTASLWLVALTGLSVGGLSCLAVQGGLLAAMIAQREASLQGQEARQRDRVLPIAQFLTAKVVAYAALGAVLGFFGSKIPLSLQGWMLIAAGVFMVLMVLQMYDAHPLLRRLAPTPPKAVQRLLRRESRRGGVSGPWLLGAMTVFIPCGVTLAMEFLAIASESALRGMLIMTAFTLGTVPTFLVVGVVATQLGKSAYRVFKPVAAVAVVAIALMSMVSGARLLGIGVGSPGGTAVDAAVVEPVAEPVAVDRTQMTAVQEATVQVATGRYEPARVRVKAGVPTRLHLVTSNTQGCIRAFVIPSLGIERMLPATGSEVVELPPAVAGTSIPFMCSMGMYTGVIEVTG